MKDEASRRPAAPQGGVQHPAGQASVAPPAERPGQHAARALIQDHREKAPLAPDRQVGDVAHPDLIGGAGRRPAGAGSDAGHRTDAAPGWRDTPALTSRWWENPVTGWYLLLARRQPDGSWKYARLAWQ